MFRTLLVALCMLATAMAPAFADSPWPQKPVRLIVPFPGGGSADALCRNVGAEIAFHAEPDGYTLLCSPPGPLSINHNLYKSIPYDWAKFVPVTVLAIVPNVITARKDLPANSAQELVAQAKANPGKLTFASQGNGSTSHLSAEMFMHMTGVEMVHVPYKGEGPALVDIVAGRVDIFIGNIAAALRFEKSGQVKFLGLAAKRRSPVAPDVPAAAEIGLPNLIASAWFGLVAPPGTAE